MVSLNARQRFARASLTHERLPRPCTRSGVVPSSTHLRECLRLLPFELGGLLLRGFLDDVLDGLPCEVHRCVFGEHRVHHVLREIVHSLLAYPRPLLLEPCEICREFHPVQSHIGSAERLGWAGRRRRWRGLLARRKFVLWRRRHPPLLRRRGLRRYDPRFCWGRFAALRTAAVHPRPGIQRFPFGLLPGLSLSLLSLELLTPREHLRGGWLGKQRGR